MSVDLALRAVANEDAAELAALIASAPPANEEPSPGQALQFAAGPALVLSWSVAAGYSVAIVIDGHPRRYAWSGNLRPPRDLEG